MKYAFHISADFLYNNPFFDKTDVAHFELNDCNGYIYPKQTRINWLVSVNCTSFSSSGSAAFGQVDQYKFLYMHYLFCIKNA